MCASDSTVTLLRFCRMPECSGIGVTNPPARTHARIRNRSCNIQPCPAGSPDFREQQCSEFNNNNFNIQGIPNDVKWVPKYAGSNHFYFITFFLSFFFLVGFNELDE